ncbi:hypothetical protein [Prauserella marina]|uniref:hypothetical protein n=1 Tax=Prauserella marina TaxID=530584 RepID=UPI000B80F2BB|nr:hypothetical protein [Prauserella marina]
MTRRPLLDHANLRERFPGGVAPRATLVALGMSHAAISRLCRPGGPWRRPIPGVVVLANNAPTRHQRNWAALTHAGRNGMLTGVAAARLHGIVRLPPDTRVHVLIPHERRVASRGFATIERTIHLPDPVAINGVPVAPLARALVDAARRMDSLRAIREMIADAVQRRLCTPAELRRELDQGSTIGSALPKIVISEMERGVRAAADSWAARAVKRGGLPAPEWNAEVRDDTGAVLGTAQAFWPNVGLAWEVDSPDFHLTSAGYQATTSRLARFTSAGIVVVQTRPARLLRNPDAVLGDLRQAFDRPTSRPPPAARNDPDT